MENKFIKLSNISSNVPLKENTLIQISRDVFYMCMTLRNDKTFLYCISKNNGTHEGPVWEDQNINSFTFSDDGCEILFVSKANNFKIYKLLEASIVLLKEMTEENLLLVLQKFDIELNEESNIIVYKFSKKYVVLFIDNKWLVTLKKNSEDIYMAHNKLQIASCVTVVVDRLTIFTLTAGGNVSAYDLDSGQLLGIVHLYAMIPPTQIQDVLSFTCLSIDFDGKLLAVSDRASEVFLVKMKNEFIVDNEQGSRWDCGASVMSFGSDTSRTTTSSRIQTKIIMDTVSLSPSVFQDVVAEKSPKITWNSYLASLYSNAPSGNSLENSSSEMTRMLDPPLGLTVRALQLRNNELSVWYTEPDSQTGGVYYLHDLVTGSCVKECLSDDVAVVPGGLLGLRDAFVSPRGLFMFLGSFSHDTLISKLVHCMEMESLGRLLQSETWTNLIVPLPAVVAAFGQKRLDVAQLALNLHVHGLKNSFISISNEDNDNNRKKRMVDFLQLLKVIQKTCADYKRNPALREQLISSTLQQINCLLDFLCTCHYDQTFEFVQKVMYQVVEFRKHLVGHGQVQEIKDQSEISAYCPKEMSDDWQKWTEMDDEKVIQDAVLNNSIPLCQVFFMKGRSWSQKAFLLKFNQSVDSWILSLVEKFSFEEAERILERVGKDPHRVLLEICVTSEHHQLRDQVAQYLSEKGAFPNPESTALKFLRQVEEVLNTIDFHELNERRFSEEEEIIKLQTNSVKIPISKVLEKPEDWKQYVFISLFFNVPGAGVFESFLQPKLVWLYLLEHNRDDFLCLWITCHYSQKHFKSLPSAINNWTRRMQSIPLISSGKDLEYISGEHLLDIFEHWNITEEMVNSVTFANTMSITKEMVLNHLSSYGIFCESEKSDVKCILKRIIFTGSISRLPEILSQKTGNLTYHEFQSLFTKHLIDNDLHEIAFPCLEDFEFNDQQIKMLCNAGENPNCEWLSLWFIFKEMKKNAYDDSVVYNAIIESARYLSKGNLKDYLMGHPLVVLALIIFERKSIAETLTCQTNIPQLDEEILCATLKHFPVLEQAIISLTNPNEETPDITVYELLAKNSPFDVSKLFNWQQSSGMNVEEYPHFSSPKLVEKYGMEYKMTYLIYLRLARPCFAACRFAVDQYKTYATLSQKRIKDAANAAHWLALKHFNDIEVTSACLAFAEILGEDSSRMKVDISCIKKVYSFLNDKENNLEESNFIRTFGEMVNELVHHNSNAAAELLNLLEKALAQDLGHQNYRHLNEKSIEEISHWGLAVKFARLHGLKLPEYFIKQLAASDNLLLFILFVEIFQYPIEQVKEATTYFKSLSLQEHLFHALQVEVSEENKPGTSRLIPRDSQKYLYSKSFPRKTKLKQDDVSSSLKTKRMKRRREDNPDQQKGATDKMMGLAASLSSGSSAEEAVGNSLISYDVWGVDEKQDIFVVLLKCHNAPDPVQALLHASYCFKNPVLAVFATCYNLNMVVTCFSTWLMVSLPTSSSEKIERQYGTSVHDFTWSEAEVGNLLEEAVSINFIATLQHGCWIFLPENPLGHLMDFLYEATEMKDFEECALKMKLFKATYLNLKNDASYEPENFMWDNYWLGQAAVNLSLATLSSLSSLHFILEFLTVLIEGNFVEHLPDPLPDLEYIYRLVSCLELTDVFPDMHALLNPSDTSLHKDEVTHCLNELVKSKQFSSALQLSVTAGWSQDPVLIAQWNDKFEQSCNQSLGRDYFGFWKKCAEKFHKAGVLPYTAAQFFQKHAEKLEDLEERFRVLQLAVEWLKEAAQTYSNNKPAVSDQQIASAELLMWNCWLQAESELPLSVEDSGAELLYVTKDRIIELSGITHLQAAAILESEEEKEKVHNLIGKLLDLGNLVCACRVEAIYGLQNQNLRVLLLCLGLAEGTLSPYELTAEQRLLFSEVPRTRTLSHRRRALMSSISTLSHSPGTHSLLLDYVEIPPRDQQDTLSTLEKLTARLTHGIKIGNRIVMCYRVAMNLDMNYLEVLMLREPLTLLRTALADDCLNKFIVAGDIINAAQINGNDVSDFMATEILEAVTRSKLKGEVSGTSMWGVDLESCFHLVLDVCSDQSALGKKLLNLASQTNSSKVLGFHDAHVICVELIIHAHNCYVAALNMEGIGSVLQICETITSRLQKKEEWALMVRLLTGVERYTEMQYIFRILYDNEQFEYLLAKGLDKFKGLKVAVVDYLKRRCPEDRKLCEMVSLRFGMFEEVAIFWESDGLVAEDAVLQMAVKDPSSDSLSLLPNTEDVKKQLVNAMDCFKHAAEFFLKGELLIRARRLVHHAELIALQRFFISTVPSGKGAPLLLRLNKEQVTTLVTHLLTFPQAYLVVRAYDHSVDWAAALYQHCVLDGDESYFSSFIASKPLSSSLVEDIVRRFQVNRNLTANSENMMKKFIERVDSLELKYCLASQLGFRDLIEELLNGPEDDVAYLKDTVWQHGYRR